MTVTDVALDVFVVVLWVLCVGNQMLLYRHCCNLETRVERLEKRTKYRWGSGSMPND